MNYCFRLAVRGIIKELSESVLDLVPFLAELQGGGGLFVLGELFSTLSK